MFLMNCRRAFTKLANPIRCHPFQNLEFIRGVENGRNLRRFSRNRLFMVSNKKLFPASSNSNDGCPPAVYVSEDIDINNAPHQENTLFSKWDPPRYLWRGLSVFVLAGQVIIRTLKGKVHGKNTLQQLDRVGPKSVGVCVLTAAFVGMAFTIQFVREFTRLGLNRAVGGVLALAFARELSPVVTSIVVAGRIGSSFAAELGTMQVSEQTDTLRVLGSDPVDYLVTPRVIASFVALPFLTLICFTVSMASSAILAEGVYGISINIILDSAQRALKPWDILSAMLKSQVFGGIISVVSCAWGVTTMGGAKGVGELTTSAVVLSIVGNGQTIQSSSTSDLQELFLFEDTSVHKKSHVSSYKDCFAAKWLLSQCQFERGRMREIYVDPCPRFYMSPMITDLYATSQN